MSGRIGADPLFLGLTRPPLLLGVSYKFFVLNMMTSLLGFIVTSNFAFFAMFFPIHLLFYYISLKEPRAIELFITASSKCRICRNRWYYKSNSYDIF